MRIGELSRRTGVPPATLRVWERRYALLRPTRTSGGQRAYSSADLARVRQFLALVDGGRRPAAAARTLADRVGAAAPADADDVVDAAWRAVDGFDDRSFRGVLHRAEEALPIPDLLDTVLAPLLRRLAVSWREHPRNVAREHFTSTLVRAHLVRLLGELAHREGPLAVAATPEHESHDIGALMAAVVLAAHGWQPVLLGANTPWPSISTIVDELQPELLVMGAELRRPARRLLEVLEPPASCLVVLGGHGFQEADAAAFTSTLHHGGPYRELPLLVDAGIARMRDRR